MTKKGEVFNRGGHADKVSCESIPLVQISVDVQV